MFLRTFGSRRPPTGAFRATWRTRPWAQRQRGGTRGHRTWRDGPTAARIYSSKQSREGQGNKQRNRGTGRLPPREETLEPRSNGGDAGTPRVDGGGASAARGELRLARTGQTRGAQGEPRGVPSCGWRGRTHRGNGRGEGSTATMERAADFGEERWSSLGTLAERGRGQWCSAKCATERGEECGRAPKKARARGSWPENARTWARPWRGAWTVGGGRF
jgi:hypothetical protein